MASGSIFPSDLIHTHPTIAYRKIDGFDYVVIEIDGCRISFSYEDPGVQISFEGMIEESRAEEIANKIKSRIENVSGQAGELVRMA